MVPRDPKMTSKMLSKLSQKWSPEGPWGPQWAQNPICFFMGPIFEPFWTPFGAPRDPQGDSKIVPKCNFCQNCSPEDCFFECFTPCDVFIIFSIDFSMIFGGPDPQNVSLFTMFYKVLHFSSKLRKWLPLGPQSGPRIDEKSMKHIQKSTK